MSPSGPDPGGPSSAEPGPVEPGSSAAVDQRGGGPPGWFRRVVWDSLLAALCPLFPVPFVDDWALAKVRRRMVDGLCARHGVIPTKRQRRQLAGRGSGFSCLGLAVKGIVYPLRKVLRKILYFLAVKEAIDTFSLVFHQGYLLHSALTAGALGAGTPSDEAVERVGGSIFGTLEEADTKPIEALVRGIFRRSRRLVASTIRWVTRVVRGRGLDALESEGSRRAELAERSPDTEALLDRLLSALWDQEDHLRRLDAALAERLAAIPATDFSTEPGRAHRPPS